MKYTVYCVRCMRKKAKIWGGHVCDGLRHVIAGWCSNRCLDTSNHGFVGHFVAGMGKVAGESRRAALKEKGTR